MSVFSPFSAILPTAELADKIIAPPYDVVDHTEAKRIYDDNPHSFIQVSRADLFQDAHDDPYNPAVYDQAQKQLQHMLDAGALYRDNQPCYYVYAMRTADSAQLGIACAVQCAAYTNGYVKRHELTRAPKEDDRTNHITATGAHTGPVLAMYQPQPALDQLLHEIAETTPLLDATDAKGVRHLIWRVHQASTIDALTKQLNLLPALYIADGHHRAAAGARAGALANSGGRFLTVAWPADNMTILGYHRLIKGLNGHTPAEFIALIERHLQLAKLSSPRLPAYPHEIICYTAQQWYSLAIPPQALEGLNAKARLAVSILYQAIIKPILGVEDMRHDERLTYVGGDKTPTQIAERVDQGVADIAFLMHPTTSQQVIDIANIDEIMPPKSTWFEPKLADGLVSLVDNEPTPT